jgi:hypothetical protein
MLALKFMDINYKDSFYFAVQNRSLEMLNFLVTDHNSFNVDYLTILIFGTEHPVLIEWFLSQKFELNKELVYIYSLYLNQWKINQDSSVGLQYKGLIYQYYPDLLTNVNQNLVKSAEQYIINNPDFLNHRNALKEKMIE